MQERPENQNKHKNNPKHKDVHTKSVPHCSQAHCATKRLGTKSPPRLCPQKSSCPKQKENINTPDINDHYACDNHEIIFGGRRGAGGAARPHQRRKHGFLNGSRGKGKVKKSMFYSSCGGGCLTAFTPRDVHPHLSRESFQTVPLKKNKAPLSLAKTLKTYTPCPWQKR